MTMTTNKTIKDIEILIDKLDNDYSALEYEARLYKSEIKNMLQELNDIYEGLISYRCQDYHEIVIEEEIKNLENLISHYKEVIEKED